MEDPRIALPPDRRLAAIADYAAGRLRNCLEDYARQACLPPAARSPTLVSGAAASLTEIVAFHLATHPEIPSELGPFGRSPIPEVDYVLGILDLQIEFEGVVARGDELPDGLLDRIQDAWRSEEPAGDAAHYARRVVLKLAEEAQAWRPGDHSHHSSERQSRAPVTPPVLLVPNPLQGYQMASASAVLDALAAQMSGKTSEGCDGEPWNTMVAVASAIRALPPAPIGVVDLHTLAELAALWHDLVTTSDAVRNRRAYHDLVNAARDAILEVLEDTQKSQGMEWYRRVLGTDEHQAFTI